MQAAHDHLGFSGEADDEGDGAGAADRQISQADFWEGGLMKVHVEHAQDDIFTVEAKKGFFLLGFWENRKGRRRRLSVILGSNAILNALFCRFSSSFSAVSVPSCPDPNPT